MHVKYESVLGIHRSRTEPTRCSNNPDGLQSGVAFTNYLIVPISYVRSPGQCVGWERAEMLIVVTRQSQLRPGQ